jgi:hypothetical protein
MIYGLPDVGRCGLGHSLLAWGRCHVWCRRTGALPLAPNWFRPRIGPYLRRERDKRNYFLLFQAGNAIGGIERLKLLLTLPKLLESEADDSAPPVEPSIIVFRTIADNDIRRDFAAIQGHADLLHHDLVAMTRPQYRPKPLVRHHIAVHVRLGDFSAPANEQTVRDGRQNVRVPIRWYASALAALRKALGDIPAIVYSDGADNQLAEILELPAVQRAPRQPSITDLLSIAQADALIGSGSGFSIWGSFLGRVPRLSFPGQSLVSVLDSHGAEAVMEEDDPVPTTFIDSVLERRRQLLARAA